MAAAEAALTSDPALGYSLIGALAPGAAAALSDDELLRAIAARSADLVVITVGGGDPAADRAVLDALRRTGMPVAVVPSLHGLPVAGFRQHYFLGHDIVMLVGRSNLARPVVDFLRPVSIRSRQPCCWPCWRRCCSS